MARNNDFYSPSNKLLKITFIIVFVVLLIHSAIWIVQDFIRARREIDDFFQFAGFFVECLVGLFVCAFFAVLFGSILALIIEVIYEKFSAANDRGETIVMVGLTILSLAILCVLLYGVYSLYRPLFMTDLDRERENFDPENDYVYITETGSKYHLSSCPALKSIANELYIWNAENEGYEPCGICKPK